MVGWRRQGMNGGAEAHYGGIVAFSQTDFTEDLKKITIPTLVTYKDLPHGLPTTHADVVNAELLEFIRS